MFWHFIRTLAKEEPLGFLLVVATTASLVVDAVIRPSFEVIRLLPVAFLGVYLWVHLKNVWRLARQTYESVPIPYSICLAQTNEWYRSALRQQEDKLRKLGVPWEGIKRSFRLHRLDWSFFDETRLTDKPEHWLDTANRVHSHFGGLADRVELQTIYHIFLVTPAPIALAVGARAGRRIPYVLYQHAGSVRDPYTEVCNMAEIASEEGYHLLNERVSTFEMINVGQEPQHDAEVGVGDKVLMVWNFTGHKLPKPYPDCGAVLTVNLSLKGMEGHIPLGKSWMSLAREIASATFKYLDQGAEVHVLPGIPSTLAFMVGSILGTTNSLHIHYYNKAINGYHRTFSLDELH